MSKELALVIPVYNEADIIGVVIEDWTQALRQLSIDFELRLYNDGSKDQTINVLRALEGDYPELVVIDKPNSGHGPTILQGYLESEAEYIFQVDSDNEMKAKHFEKLWKEREEYDFILGKRNYTYDHPLARRVVSYIAKVCINLFYGRGISDVNVPYRLMAKAKFEPIFRDIPTDTFAPNLIVSGMAVRNKLKIKTMDVPTDFRTTGSVSIQKLKLLKVALRSFRQTIAHAFK